MKIKVISLFEPQNDTNGIYVNTTSKAATWERDLSPFHLGPCKLYDGEVATIMENGWQFSKVYGEHVTRKGHPTRAYFEWAQKGWADNKPHRYPMGKGRKPLYSYWEGERLQYIDARKRIYGPLYARAVQDTDGYAYLLRIVGRRGGTLYLRDFDAYRHEDEGMTLTDVLNNPHRKMGHAFVLAMMLTDDKALLQMDI